MTIAICVYLSFTGYLIALMIYNEYFNKDN